MSNESLAIRQKDAMQSLTLDETLNLGQILAKSGFFSDSRDAAQCVVKVLAGRELGFGPVASMTGIYIVKGRVTMSANLIAAAIQRSRKYSYRVAQMDANGCTIKFFEGSQEIGVSSFTADDAKLGGLNSNDTYRKFPRNMLFARALTNGARWYTPEIFGGPVYTPEELGAEVDEHGEILNPQAAPAPNPQPQPKQIAVTAPAGGNQPDARASIVNDLTKFKEQSGATNKDITAWLRQHCNGRKVENLTLSELILLREWLKGLAEQPKQTAQPTQLEEPPVDITAEPADHDENEMAELGAIYDLHAACLEVDKKFASLPDNLESMDIDQLRAFHAELKMKYDRITGRSVSAVR